MKKFKIKDEVGNKTFKRWDMKKNKSFYTIKYNSNRDS